ncbi:peroxisomal 2,4-dienoyl-CoA reductase [Hyaloraphidium curvatum]|nr:peroxisomal 2,4-dienoyl-CoA reductase [Hyaloraphidium curvatum]
MAPATGAPPTTSVFSPTLLAGRVAFITGGGSGIGKAISEAFLRHGAAGVCIASRDQAKLDKAADDMRTKVPGAKVLAIAADVRNPEQMFAVADRTRAEFGRLDICIANAAGNYPTQIKDTSPNGFKTVVDIDLLGTFNTLKACFPHLKDAAAETGFAAVIAITAGGLPERGSFRMGHALSAKAGIDALVRTVANEWGELGIRANSLGPGPIDDTGGMERLTIKGTEAERFRGIPLGRNGNLTDMQMLALFLASTASWNITGANVISDGGWWLRAENQPIDMEQLKREDRLPRVGRGGKL